MNTDSYYPIIEEDNVHKDISFDIEKWFHLLNWDERRRKRPLPWRKKQKNDCINEKKEVW